MTPTTYASLANRLFSRRWWFLGASLCGFMLFAIVLLYAPPPVLLVFGVMAGPVLFVPWGIVCLCFWFHPELGSLQSGDNFVGRLPKVLQGGIRWYAAIFLSLFFVFAALIWPVFVVLGYSAS